jgi:hypothetical protein
VLWYIRHIIHSVAIRKTLVIVFWYVRHIVVSVVIHKTYCWRITTLTTKCLTCHNTNNNISYVSHHWQQCALRIRVLTTISLTHHNTVNTMSYASQHWHQYVLGITTLTTIMLWYVRHSVDSVVIRKTYCCQCCDT